MIIKTSAKNLSIFIFLSFLLILPIFGKSIDYQESIIFYGLPFFFFLNIIPQLKTFRLSRLSVFVQITLIILYIISAILSFNPGYSYYSFFIFLTVLSILNLSFVYIQDFDIFYRFIIIFSCFYSLIFILSRNGIISLLPKISNDNFILQNWGHSYLADFLIFPIIILISKISKNNFKYFLPLVVFLSTSLILTNSRSVLVAVILGILFLSPKNKLYSHLKEVTLICLVFGLVYIFQHKDPTSYRFTYWQQAIVNFQESPLWGKGPETFNAFNTRYAHNSVLEYLSGNGLIFTFIFCLSVLSGLVRQYRKNNLLFCLGLAAFINSLLGSSWSSPGILVISLIFLFHGGHPSNRFKQSPVFLTVLSVLIFLFFLSKTSSDYFFLQKNYSLSLKLDPFNLNSLLMTPDSPNLQRFYPHRQKFYFVP